MKRKDNLERLVEELVDRTKDTVIDKIYYCLSIFSLIFTSYLFLSSLTIIKSPIIKTHSMFLYSILLLLNITLFYLSMLGKVTQKPANRPKVFLFMSLNMCFLTYCLLAEIFNSLITTYIDRLLAVTEVPLFLIHTNVRIVTVILPLLIVILVFRKSLIIPFNKLYRKELLEYSLDIFTRTVDKITDYTIDLKLCEDISTGKDVIIPEKISYRHILLSGSSGGGKTALAIRPFISQLFLDKATFREEIKKLALEALNEGLCYLKAPITNKYINENFSMDLFGVYEDKKDEFKKKFSNYIIGERENSKQLYNKTVHFDKNNTITNIIPVKFHSDLIKIKVTIDVFINDMVTDGHQFEFENNNINKIYENEDYTISISCKENPLPSDENEELIDNALFIIITSKKDASNYYSFNTKVDTESTGKIIYRDLGVTVIAPDGGLSKDTVKIAEENGIKIHKIDPKMEEIEKGHIAKFNPLLVGSPEKAGDIISSILVSMEQNSGKDSNPYFTNASIRAVRNLVILLKVMYPRLNNGLNPTLRDVLDLLNNTSDVVPYVEAMAQDEYLRNRWKTVIDYFKNSFYPPIVNDRGIPVDNSSIGKHTKKTEEAITGIINQLDNFLGREEIQYIFCDRNNSINLSEVLEKGECVAVSTRQSELGDVLGKAFALMIILSIQNAVLGRYSEDENPEIPHYLFIDEFPFYINDSTKVFFTFARKYKTSVCIAIQNLAQLAEESRVFREVIFTNCTTKIVLPGSNVEDREYFCKYFGKEEVFEHMTSVSSNPVESENAKTTQQIKGNLQEKDRIAQQELAELEFHKCFYSTVDSKGKNRVAKGYMDFIKLTPKNTRKIQYLDFESYNTNDIKENLLMTIYILKRILQKL